MLHLHRAERTSTLVTSLAAALASAPPDPFTPEIVAVPSRGVERWLAQRLSHVLGSRDGNPDGDGVCANVAFPSPPSLLAGALAAARGVDPADDPWAAGRLAWPLLDIIDGCAGEPWCAPLTSHLERVPGRRLATAQKLARCFEVYAASRPRLLADWTAGRDTDGAGSPLPADLSWQAELWRRLRAEVGAESPAEQIEAATARLAADPGLVDLPCRLSVFGPTRLTTVELDVLTALAAHRDVHLWLAHPSPALWDAIVRRESTATARRREDDTAELAANPLLASLGRDVRELQQRLLAASPEHTDEYLPPDEAAPGRLLGRLQQAIRGGSAGDDRAIRHANAAGDAGGGSDRAIRSGDGARPRHDDRSGGSPALPVLAPDDRSLQVRACHGPARQVEVLRETIVGLLADDPSLEPRDVLVMCPDVEAYASLISATFGAVDDGSAHPGHRLRVRLADRALRQTNPLLDLVARLLTLAAGKVTASEVLDLAALPPVRRRFGFTDDDLELLRDWLVTSGVRWGLDAAHRRAFGLGDIAQNTWRAGLDRILLGAAMADLDLRWVGLALPLDDVGSNDVDLAGRLAELVDRLAGVLDRLAGTHPLTDWLDTLTGALDLLGDVPDVDAWQPAQARRELAEVQADAGARAAGTALSLGDVQELLADRLQGRPTRANFRTGNLTVCSMVPMRSVPHRVVCLLGLDDGAFPRHAAIDGDDVLARDPCLGERDPRSEDRQLLLDAITAAREHLVICYTGADPRTNAPRPPAVPVAEILDAVDALAVTAAGRPAREQVVVHHPLQPFDARNFRYGDLCAVGRPFSFDRVAWRGAERAALPRDQPAPFLAAPLPGADRGDVDLDELVRWVENPCLGFVRQRLAISVPGDDEEIEDALAVELDSLTTWAVGDRLLTARLTGADVERCRQAERRRGTLPPGRLGTQTLDEVMSNVEPIVSAAAPLLATEGRAVDVTADLGGRLVTGTVGGVHGGVVTRAVYSRLGPKHRLRAWVQLLALTVADPGRRWTAVTVGRGKQEADVLQSRLGLVETDRAHWLLDDLVALRDRGLCLPLPIATNTTAAYAAARAAGKSVDDALTPAGSRWLTGPKGKEYGEAVNPEHRQVWGEKAALSVLRAAPAEPGGPDGEETLFGQLARRIWQPLLDAETLGPP